MDYCGNNTMKWLTGDGIEDDLLPPEPKQVKLGPTADRQYDDNEPHTVPPAVGDVVAVPFKDKDHNSDSFWLGKCLRVSAEASTVLLGWFQDIEGGRYKMKIGASWEEVSKIYTTCFIPMIITNSPSKLPQNIKSCIYPIDVKYDEADHNYILLTSEEDILSTIKPALK